MNILGVDYGRSKIGLAISEGKLAEPYKVIRVNNFADAVEKVFRVINQLGVTKLVVGISEGEMGKEQIRFAKELGAETFDETLSTQDAQKYSIAAGIKRKTRKEMEDAFAASIMLQNYLDVNSI